MRRPLDRLFRQRATRVFNRGGSLRFRHWRLYGERGLTGERAAVWVNEETLTVEYATDTLARYRVGYERSTSPVSTRPTTPRRSRSCRSWRMSNGTRRSVWRRTVRGASAATRGHRRGS